MPVTIRRGYEEDFPAIIKLIKEFSIFQGTPEKVTITAEQMIEDKELFQCFIAETDDKEVMAFATFFFVYYSWTGKAVYIDDLYVKEGFRKQGLGKKLLDAMIHLAKTQRCKKVRWQVSKWNTNAIEFYKKMGATIDEVEINCNMIINA